MIIKVKMFGVDCDNCGKTWFNDHYGYSYMTDESTAREWASDDGWYHSYDDDELDYCPQCHSINDDDELVINKERTRIIHPNQ